MTSVHVHHGWDNSTLFRGLVIYSLKGLSTRRNPSFHCSEKRRSFFLGSSYISTLDHLLPWTILYLGLLVWSAPGYFAPLLSSDIDDQDICDTFGMSVQEFPSRWVTFCCELERKASSVVYRFSESTAKSMKWYRIELRRKIMKKPITEAMMKQAFRMLRQRNAYVDSHITSSHTARTNLWSRSSTMTHAWRSTLSNDYEGEQQLEKTFEWLWIRCFTASFIDWLL
jgi:hypothetical protein